MKESKYIKEKLVKTIDGVSHPLKNCKLILKKYYLIGDINKKDSGHVYFIPAAGKKGKWYREETGYLVYDYRRKMYDLKNKLEIIVEKGIVDISEEGVPIFGTFSQDIENPSTTLVIYKGEQYMVLYKELVENSYYFKEYIGDGNFYERNAMPALKFTEPIACTKAYKCSLPYDSKGITGPATAKHKNLFNYPLLPAVKSFGKCTDNLTFGFEFETVKGVVPQHITDTLGLIPLRDGSIDGLEYVTIPLGGEVGIQTLIESLSELKKRTRYDKNCSVHVHIGNIPRTPEFLIALFKVLFIVQDSIFDLFPFYKQKNCGIKKKGYTKPLPAELFYALDNKIDSKSEIDKNFNYLFEFLSMGQSFYDFDNDLNNVKKHPADPQGNQKWNITSRYYWVNLIPIIFGNKQTVEFRIHTPSYDQQKLVNFLFLCTSIVNYTKRNQGQILKDHSFLRYSNIQTILKSEAHYFYKKDKETKALFNELSNFASRRFKWMDSKLRLFDLAADEDDFKYQGMYVKWYPSRISSLKSTTSSYRGLASSYNIDDLKIVMGDAKKDAFFAAAFGAPPEVDIQKLPQEEEPLFFDHEPVGEIEIEEDNGDIIKELKKLQKDYMMVNAMENGVFKAKVQK